MIDKADSIEEKEESDVSEHSSVQHQRSTFSCDENVIEEEVGVSSESDEMRSRKASVVVVVDSKAKSFEMDESESQVHASKPPGASSFQPPTSTSTQTVPTEEFPEVAVTGVIHAEGARKIAQLNVETQQETDLAQKIDEKANDTIKCSRSATESDGDAVAEEMPLSCDDQLQRQCEIMARQQSMSQDDDYEVAMVSGLLPGCVAPAPTPAPSIAPLAEIEVDPAEDDPEPGGETETKPEVERKKKRREKKERDGNESQSHTQTEANSSTDPEKSKHNDVCPWEDE